MLYDGSMSDHTAAHAVRRVPITDLIPDSANPNRHTKKGRKLLRKSVEQFKAREAGTLDKDLGIVGGNHRAEVYQELGIEEVLVIKADPGVPVFLQYDDLDLEDPANPARQVSVALNRTAQVSIDFDPGVLAELDQTVPDISAWFDEDEFKALLAVNNPPPSLEDIETQFGEHDPAAMWPEIRLRVPPEVHERFLVVMADARGASEWAKFEAVLAAVSLPALMPPEDPG